MRVPFLRIILASLLILAFVFMGAAAAAPSSGLDTGAGPWQWVRPGVQGASIQSVSFISASAGWAVGPNGLILKTTDSGANWSSQVSGTMDNLTAVKFTDSGNGWATGVYPVLLTPGPNVILHTTNGGATWSTQSLPSTGCPAQSGNCPYVPLAGMSFASASRGIIVGDGYAFYTTNGGASWAVGTGITASDALNAVHMIDANSAWAVGGGGVIYWTTNGGAGWNKLSPSPTTMDLTSVYFTDLTHGVAVAGDSTNGKLLRFNGATWEVSTNTTATPLTGVTVMGAAPGSTLVAVGGGGGIYRNGTNIWADPIDTVVTNLTTPASQTTSGLMGVSSPSATAVWAAGDGGAITASTDTGSNWSLKAGGNSVTMTSSSFISASEGWMAGNNGTVVHTADGGATWNNDNTSLPADVNVHGIHFLDANTGFAVGCQGAGCTDTGPGVAYKYSSGTWSAMSTPALTGVSLNSVHMTSATSGWAVGSGGTALRTSNGTSWVSANTGIGGTVVLNTVDATDAANNGWAVGQVSGGTAVIYSYAGGSWSTQTIPGTAPQYLTSIDMVDASNGYAVGDAGSSYKTTNGGATWTAMASGTSKILASVSFIPGNVNIGFAVGDAGRVIHTRNAGGTWSAENLGTNVPMLTVSTIDERTAFTAGQSGGILRSLRPYYFTWYDDLYSSNWVLMANPNGAAADVWFDLFIAGTQRAIPALSGTDCAGGPYAPGQVPAGCTAVAKYSGVMGGPVNAASKTSAKAVVSQRVLWPKGGSSLEEVRGQDIEKLSDHFYWTWYDQLSPGYKNWVLVANPNPFPVYYDLWIGGVLYKSAQVIQPGANDTPQFNGIMGGPVEVRAYNTATRIAPAFVMASQRVLTNYDNAFNEVPGIAATELSDNYLWTWYDQLSAGAKDWILIANPPGDAATNIYYKITIAGTERNDGSTPAGSTCKGPIADNGNRIPQFSGVQNGPVQVQTYSDAGCTVAANSIASQRITWNNDLSFEEVPGSPYSSKKDTYYWTWYDENSLGMINWVLIANPPGDATANVYYKVNIAGTDRNDGSAPAGSTCKGPIADNGNRTPRFNNLIGGPVEVRTFSDSACTVAADGIASQRVLYNGYFNEVLGTVLN